MYVKVLQGVNIGTLLCNIKECGGKLSVDQRKKCADICDVAFRPLIAKPCKINFMFLVPFLVKMFGEKRSKKI